MRTLTNARIGLSIRHKILWLAAGSCHHRFLTGRQDDKRPVNPGVKRGFLPQLRREL
jgi:hypothetical protein